MRSVLSSFMLWCSFSAEPLQNGQRRWRDGSLEEDLPMRSLSEMFNVNYFLVSQTNPHIVPVLNLKKRVNRKLGNLLEAEWKHRCVWLQDLHQCCPVLRHRFRASAIVAIRTSSQHA